MKNMDVLTSMNVLWMKGDHVYPTSSVLIMKGLTPVLVGKIRNGYSVHALLCFMIVLLKINTYLQL